MEETREKQILEINNTTMTMAKRLSDDSSIRLFREVNAKLVSEEETVNKAQDELKESLRELLSLAEEEASHLQELSSQSVDPQKKNLISELSKTEKQMEELEKELAGVTSTINQKKEVLKNFQNQATSSQLETSTCISRIRAKYCLYSKISNIKWDHTVPDGTIKGFVLKPEEKRVVPFKFDKASHSQFFITNYLWEQIDTGSDFLEEAMAASSN